MSGLLPDENAVVGKVEAIDIQAAKWMLARQMSETWSDKDQLALDAWLAESTSHVAAYWRLDDAWARTKRLKAIHLPFATQSAPARTLIRSRVIGVAASLLAAAVLAGGLWFGRDDSVNVKTYSTPVGGHLSLALTDGSKIELNTATKLSISTSGGRRSATLLKGEALFEIKHNASNPFVLSVRNHKVTDLGTKFLVRQDDREVKVSLLEGRARFDLQESASDSQSTDLAPGDVVIATRNAMSVSKRSAKQLTNELGWRNGLLIFENSTLADAAAELNRYNTQKIIVRDPTVARLTIGGKFFENDVSALVNTAQQVFGLNVHRRGNEILISR